MMLVTRRLRELVSSTASLTLARSAAFSGGDIRKKFNNEISDEDYDYQNEYQAKIATSEGALQLTSVISNLGV